MKENALQEQCFVTRNLNKQKDVTYRKKTREIILISLCSDNKLLIAYKNASNYNFN